VLSVETHTHPTVPFLFDIPDMPTITASYRGVIFDIDGTLVNSNDAHTRAWLEALQAHGHSVPYDRLRRLIGMGADKLLPLVAGVDEKSSHGKAIAASRAEAFSKRLPSLEPTRGARALLEHVHERGLMLLIATSAQPDEAKAMLEVAGLDDLCPEDVGSSTDHSKPEPDVFRAALARGGLMPHQAIAVGDTPYDIEAGRRAHVPVIALRCGGYWSDGALSGAVGIYDDPQALLERFSGSPLGISPRLRTQFVA